MGRCRCVDGLKDRPSLSCDHCSRQCRRIQTAMERKVRSVAESPFSAADGLRMRCRVCDGASGWLMISGVFGGRLVRKSCGTWAAELVAMAPHIMQGFVCRVRTTSVAPRKDVDRRTIQWI